MKRKRKKGKREAKKETLINMVISVANQKGGVGKTTLAISFSNFLVETKKELLVVDFDFQSSFYGAWKDETTLLDSEAPYEVIKQELENAEAVVESIKEDKESTVLFDLPGKLDDDNLIPLFGITDILLIPFSYDKISFESTMFFVQMAKHINGKMKMIFIPNRIKTGVKFNTQTQINEIFTGFGVVTEVIPDRVCLQRLSTISNNNEVKEIVNIPFQTILKNL